MKTRTIEIEVTETKETMLDAIYHEAPFLFKGRWYKYNENNQRLYSLCPHSLEDEHDEDWKCGKDGYYFFNAMYQLEENDVDVDLEEVIVLKDENENYWVDWEMVSEYWETDDPEDWDMEKDPSEEMEDVEVPEWFTLIAEAVEQIYGK